MSAQDLALLGFEMWIVYLEHCSSDDFETFEVTSINISLENIRRFTFVGTMPPQPTGPLSVSLMGSAWMNFISAIIRSCTIKERLQDLKQLIDPDQIGNHYHNVLWLYQVLRSADCRAFASHNPIQNRTALYQYVQSQEESYNTYMSYFVTLTGVTPQKVLRTHQGDPSFLLSYGCTYALVSKCKQEIAHIHGVLIFAWPVSISAVRSLLCGVKLGSERPVVGPAWSIEPIFCYQEYPIAYILNQEYERLIDFRMTRGSTPHPVTVKNLDTKEAQGYVFKYTPRYYLVNRGLDIADDTYQKHDFDRKYRKYISPLMSTRFYFTRDGVDKRNALEQCFGTDSIAEVEDPFSLQADDISIIQQKPILIVLSGTQYDPYEINKHLDNIGALFKYVVVDSQ